MFVNALYPGTATDTMSACSKAYRTISVAHSILQTYCSHKRQSFFINYVANLRIANFGTQIVYNFLSLPRKVL